MRIGYFITPHGFGHATRSCAIMEAMLSSRKNIQFSIFTKVPEWLFAESIPAQSFEYFEMETDLGLVQTSPFHEDELATVNELKKRVPFDQSIDDRQLNDFAKLNLDIIICDIAPMGIYIAKKLGIPSVLVENFTWDWIYEGYSLIREEASTQISYMKDLFDQVDFHIQTEPVCSTRNRDCRHVHSVMPVSRSIKSSRASFFQQLGIDIRKPTLTLSMGGIPGGICDYDSLKNYKSYQFLIPNMRNSHSWQDENLYYFGRDSNIDYPDWIAHADIVIGKMGYSTFSETYFSGTPFYYILRDKFKESSIMDDYAQSNTNSLSMTEEEFVSMKWIENIPTLLSKKVEKRINGAEQAAQFILEFICV